MSPSSRSASSSGGPSSSAVGSIAELDRLSDEACAAALAPLFEGAPRFLTRLCARRPFRDEATLLATARGVAHAMPEPEQLELIDAHPRLGAPRGSVSALSFIEQGYDRAPAVAGSTETEPARVSAEAEPARVSAELDRLNHAYEARFGFRYCVFVAGRPHAALLPGFEAALSADRADELRRALDAVVDIAADRWVKLGR